MQRPVEGSEDWGAPGTDTRFTDKLAERIAADRRPLDAVNAGISGNRILAHPADPALPRPGYVFPDGVHPNEAGSHAIASAMDLNALGTPKHFTARAADKDGTRRGELHQQGGQGGGVGRAGGR
ncbi:hypothetical protein [Streptomyces parvus]|uniref:hypothetical protein n=1 Tax=Streptomyces parvus TaxID=66428 RepID=UPI003D717076